MSARTTMSPLLVRAGLVSAVALATVGGTLVVPGASADAEAASTSMAALRTAASKKGSPYKYGASGPYRFDCSGLTLYSFKRAGKRLPRTAAAQYNRTRHLSASARRPGDLVFFHSRRGIYHVGIYAGNGRIWHAPKPGTVVRLERIWSRSVSYGRIR
ncbi:NlpC/P60 family protein [Streptomyces albofaciens JCM 4342]|uniref:C40 family peptidase n=1 Tax=Streptomyces albofaciens TaxID=66866 RepID=UPI001238A701|nr:NlpC/P60 family protein [Streptomyces albofaciens]KAA6223586.1 NlpC/P60 family protein [Streptomyces albofaciens JCM 4342]